MDMTLSKRGDYVVRSALCLARAHPAGESRKIREVVAEMAVPHTFASQILADLVRAGLATSKAGKAGGYRLARPPEEVTLLEVVEAGEGPLRSERCAIGEGPCRWERVCPLHETWVAATNALRAALAQTSLATIALRDEAIERSAYPLPADSHRRGTPTVALVDWVQVDVSMTIAERSLSRAETWLPACIKAGYLEAEDMRRGVDPGGLAWSPSAAPAVALGACGPGDGRHRRITWEAGGALGSGSRFEGCSRFEGSLQLRSLDPERTELRVEGKLRPPGSSATADPALTERLARTTLRTTLREAARVVDHMTPERRQVSTSAPA